MAFFVGGTTSTQRSSERTLLVNTQDTSPEKKRNDSSQKAFQLANALIYGIINSIRTIPTMYGYAVIIFSHPSFAGFTPALSKLVVFSSAVHQIMFTLLSSLPFAIGQVQDAGLIFLTTMATSICNSLGEDAPAEAKVATTVVTIGIATALLGVCLVAMGRMKLAAFASYLPMPVVGGYLAFIGVFCLYAGLALCTGLVVNDFTSMVRLLDDTHNVLLCLPGVVGGALLLLISQRFKNPFALSSAIVLVPAFFFLVLAVGDVSLEEARNDGWVNPISKSASMSELLELFDFSLVHWDQVPKQMVTWIGMVFIVAFSSSLDVVAIEIDMGTKLQINHELETVGWSNVVSGLLGGYTGSYIFSQTVFTCRSKTNSRIVGVCVILSEFAIVAAPVSVMSYVPRFFLAATLVFVALDLMLEWLVLSYRKMSVHECAVVWLSFLAINTISLDVGILVGIGCAILNFLLNYVQVPIVSSHHRFSAIVRDIEESTVLTRKRGAIAYFEFRGYLFFGSSVQILDRIQKAVYVRKSRRVSDESESYPMLHACYQGETPIECLDGSAAPDSNMPPTEHVVMDFSHVTGMDATAASSAFLILQRYCKNKGISVVFSSVRCDICDLLLKNGIGTENSYFSSTESALEFCENQLLVGREEAHRSPRANGSIREVLAQLIRELTSLQNADSYFLSRDVPEGHEFYHGGQLADEFFLLTSGRVVLYTPGYGSKTHRASVQLESPSVFGEVSFFSRQRRQETAVATEASTVLEVSRDQFDKMTELAPALAIRLRDVVVQSMAISIVRNGPH